MRLLGQTASKPRFFYVLYSVKSSVFDQSEYAQGHMINLNVRLVDGSYIWFKTREISIAVINHD